MLTDEMTEEQMAEAMTNAHAFELKIRAALIESITMDLRAFANSDPAETAGMLAAAEMIETNY